MRDRQEQRAHARTLTLLVAAIIFLIYLLLEGEQGDVVHVFRDERYLYFSLGEYGSFQIYELRRPRPQSQPGLVTAPGDPQRKVYFSSLPLDKSRTALDLPLSELKIQRGDVTRAIARDNTLFVVDPNRGLIIYDITLRTAPIEIGRYEFYDIHDLVFFEQIAFVAAGKAGIYLLDLSHPDLIQVLGHYDTAGSAETVLPVFINFGEMSIQADAEVGQVQEQIFQQYLAFVADGDSGYVILDFKTAEPVFRELQLLRAENTPGFVSDISFRDSYLFLADGKAGIRIFDIFSGGFDPANPTFLGVFDTPGTAYQISLRRNEMLIADGEAGLLVANLNSLFQSQSITAIAILPAPAEITSLAISKDIAVLGGGEQGVFIADISDPYHPVLVDKLSTPGLSSLSQIFEAAWNRSWSAKETASLYDMGKEILIASVVFLFFIIVLIPYIIPASSLAAALSSVFLFVRYLFGRVGPAILVEAGEIKTDPLAQETNTTRPVILDNSSVGLVRDSQGSLHMAVPGTSRLYPGEALVETIDLQSRTFIFGPADEDPFEPQQPNEDEIMARHRARRRAETQAFTQDGAEIVPNLIVDFRVKSTSYSGTAPFGFHSGYAFQALRQEYAADKTFVEGHHPSSSLDGLPGKLAIRAWREVLPYFTLDDLFSPLDGNDGLAGQRLKFGFEFIVDCVNQLLRQQFVDEIGQHGHLTGNQVFSEAYNELEQAGLEVQRVWIVNPRIVPDIHDEFLGRYFSAWDAEVQEFQLHVQARYDEIEAVSQQQALVDFARTSIQSLAQGLQRYQSMPANFLFLNRSLYLLLRGTSSLARIDNEDKMQLNSLLEWLESNLET